MGTTKGGETAASTFAEALALCAFANCSLTLSKPRLNVSFLAASDTVDSALRTVTGVSPLVGIGGIGGCSAGVLGGYSADACSVRGGVRSSAVASDEFSVVVWPGSFIPFRSIAGDAALVLTLTGGFELRGRLGGGSADVISVI